MYRAKLQRTFMLSGIYLSLPVPNGLPNQIYPIVITVMLVIAVLAYHAGKEH